jgi:hypothetical protein
MQLQLGRVRLRNALITIGRQHGRASRAVSRPTVAAAVGAAHQSSTVQCERARARAARSVMQQLVSSAPSETAEGLGSHVHLLPCPPAPPAWARFKAAAVQRGLEGIKGELQPGLFVLPEEGKQGRFFAGSSSLMVDCWPSCINSACILRHTNTQPHCFNQRKRVLATGHVQGATSPAAAGCTR